MSVFDNIYLNQYIKSENEIQKNNATTNFKIEDLYLSTAFSTFTWKSNIIKMNIMQIEQYLQCAGRIAVFRDGEEIKIFPAYPAGRLLEDGTSSDYIIISSNGKTWRKAKEEVTIIYNNQLKLPTLFLINLFAEKSSFALQAVDASLARSMLPTLFAVENETQLKTLNDLKDRKNLLERYAVVFKDGAFGSDGIQRFSSFDNRETDVLSQWDIFSRYDRLFYRTFGISTVGIQKNERLTEAESTGEEEMTRYTLLKDMYDRRIDGIEKANEKFGSDLSIEVNRDKKTVFELTQNNENKITMAKIESTKGSNLGNVEVNNDEL